MFVYKAAPKMPDFEVYWKAAARAAHAEPLYRPSDGHYQFKYLPAFAVLAIPLGRMPLATAEIVWFATSVALLVTLLALAVRLPVERRKPVRWLVVLTVLAFGKFYAHELVLGQVNILFAVIATAAFLAMRSGREVSAGALVALAIVIKPYAVLFLPWLVARRRLPSIVSACAGLAVVLVLPAALYGWDGNVALHREWWRTVTRDHRAQPVDVRQRVARGDVLPLGRSRASCRRAWRLAPRCSCSASPRSSSSAAAVSRSPKGSRAPCS